MVSRFGMSDKIGPAVFGHDEYQVFLGRELTQMREYSDETANLIDVEVRRLIEEAAAQGARFIVFPEGFIPGHCYWYHHHVATGPKAMALANALFRNSVEIPGPEVAAKMALR